MSNTSAHVTCGRTPALLILLASSNRWMSLFNLSASSRTMIAAEGPDRYRFFNRFLADCARRATCPFRERGKPGPAFDALMRRIDAKPLPARAIEDDRLVGPTYAWGAVAGSLYSKGGWGVLASALALGSEVKAIVTYDPRLAASAREHAIEAVAPS